MKKACLFGIYDPQYSRSRVLKRALEENGLQIVECRADPREFSGFRKYSALLKEWRKIRHEHFEHVFVCFPGHSVVWLARLLFGRIIFDAFVSLYDSNVNDRRIYSRYFPRAWYDWLLDWSSTHLSWRILMDTNEHAEFLSKTFFIERRKIIRLLVSTDDKVFYPRASLQAQGAFKVHFHGSFIPLQGIEHIIDAANLLRGEDIHFNIIGHGQEYPKVKAYAEKLGLGNIEFMNKVALEDLPSHIANADVCLGVFGSSSKALRVIPNKVYEYAAMGKPIITRDSPAIREVFLPEKNIILSNPGGEAIAQAIIRLKSSPEAAQIIGREARILFEKELQPKKLGKELLNELT